MWRRGTRFKRKQMRVRLVRGTLMVMLMGRKSRKNSRSSQEAKIGRYHRMLISYRWMMIDCEWREVEWNGNNYIGFYKRSHILVC